MARRPHLTRTAIGLLVVIAVWIGVVAAALRLLDLAATRAWLAREVATRLAAAVNQPARVADVRVYLSPPRLAVRGLEIGPPGRPLLRVDVAEAAIGDFRFASRELDIDVLRLHGVRVDAQAPADGGASGGHQWLHVIVRQLDVDGVEIARLGLPGGLTVRAHDVEARWTGSRRDPVSAAVLHVGAFSLDVPGIETIAGSLTAWGRRTPQGWRVGKLRGRGAGWSLDGTGEVAGGRVAGEGTLAIQLAALERTLHIGAGLDGGVEVHFAASAEGKQFQVDADVSSPRVSVAGFPFDDVDGEAHLSPDGLDASLSDATFAGGHVEGSYSLSGFGPPWHHQVAARGDGVSLAEFLHRLGADDAGLSASCAVNAEVSWDGESFKRGAGTGIADLKPGGGDVPAAGRVVLALARDGALQIEAKSTTLAGAPVRWSGRLELGTWVPDWHVEGERVPIPVAARVLRGWIGTDVVPAELHGETAFAVGLRGPFSNLHAEGRAALAPVAFGPVDADGLEASFAAGDGVLAVSSGDILVGAGRVTGHGELRYGAGNALHLDLEGRGVPLARMVAWGGVRAPLAGKVNFTGSLGGTLAAPVAEADLGLTDVAAAGVAFGDGRGRVALVAGVVRVAGLTVGPFSASGRVDLNRRDVEVDAKLLGFGLEGISPPLARLAGGALDCTLHGSFPFDSPAGRLEVASASGASGFVELDSRSLRVEVTRAPAWRLSGELRRAGGEFRGKVSYAVDSWRQVLQDLGAGDVPADGRMKGEAEVRLAPRGAAHVDGVIRELEVEVEQERAVLEKPTAFHLDGGAIRFDGATMAGPRSTLFVRGGRNADGTLFGNISGELPGALLGLVWREARPSGRVELLGEISGTDAAPRFEGVARVADGSLRLPGLPAPATRIAGVIELNPDAIRLQGVDFALLGGEGVCDGRVVLSPRLQLDLGLRVRSVHWPLMLGFTPILTGDVRLVGTLDSLSLTGKGTLQRTVYRRAVNLQKLVLEELLTHERARPTEGAPMTLNLAVDVPGTLEFDTPLARVAMRGAVRVVGTTAQYGVLGRLEALPGGELELADVRYDLDRGIVTFSDPDRFEPRLDILARTTVQTFDITVGLNGTLDRLIPTFSSSPPLPDMDIVSLLSTGRRADVAGQAQAGAVASSFLTEQLTGAVTHRARSLLDVDQLRVDPFAATQTGSPTARLTVVKQLSHDWTVTVSTNLTSNREEVVTSRWLLGQGVYLEANRDVDGAYALDIKWQFRY